MLKRDGMMGIRKKWFLIFLVSFILLLLPTIYSSHIPFHGGDDHEVNRRCFTENVIVDSDLTISENLHCQEKSVIIISSDVTLDCANNRLSGGFDGSPIILVGDSDVDSPEISNIVIKNCVFSGSDRGILVSHKASNVRIINNTFTDIGTPEIINTGEVFNIPLGAVLTEASGYGISVGGSSVQILDNYFEDVWTKVIRVYSIISRNDVSRADFAIIRRNIIIDSGEPIILDNVLGATIENNNVSNNQGDAITLITSSSRSIQGNSITGNIGNGLFVTTSDDVTISENTIERNTADGIKILDSSTLSILTNNINGNVHGINTHLSDTITIRENELNDNTMIGIRLDGSEAEPSTMMTIQGNTLNGNEAGIRVHKLSRGTISRNELLDTSLFGIQITNSRGTTINENRIDSSSTGLSLSNSLSVTLQSNSILNSNEGIKVFSSEGITVNRNNVCSNELDFSCDGVSTVDGIENKFQSLDSCTSLYPIWPQLGSNYLSCERLVGDVVADLERGQDGCVNIYDLLYISENFADFVGVLDAIKENIDLNCQNG
jgi:parallel beta-helix repeat protein